MRLCVGVSKLRCVTSKDKICCGGFLMTGEAGFHESGGGGFAVLKMPEAPAAGCGVLYRILHHELNVGGSSRDERLGLPKDLVVLVRRNVMVVQCGEHGAVREGKRACPVRFDRHIVSQQRAQAIEIAGFMGRGDPAPVAVSAGHFGDKGRSGSVGMSGCRGDEGGKGAQSCKCEKEEREAFHRYSP